MSLTAVIADDEESPLVMQRAFLSRKGYTIVAEKNHGGNLVELAVRHQPNLLLTDNNMPQEEGIQAVTELRAQGYTLPIVINSGKPFELTDTDHSWTPVEEQGYHPKLDVHLIAKPYGLADLERSIVRATSASIQTA